MAAMASAIKARAADPVGQMIEGLPRITATALKNNFGKATLEALKQGVAIMRHNKPQFVLLPVEQYASLQRARSAPLEALAGEFDLMVANMQKAAAKRGAAKLFTASPQDLGRAAVKQARASR